MHDERVTQLGTFYIEWANHGIARRGAADVVVVVPGGVERLGDDDVAGLDARNDGMAVVERVPECVGGNTMNRLRSQRRRDHVRSDGRNDDSDKSGHSGSPKWKARLT